MQTAGEILKKKREEKNLTLDQVEEAIKIKKKFLKSLEDDRAEKLPSEAYARGFIKNYAEFLDLPSEKILAIFRRQFRGGGKTRPLIKKIEGEPFLKITPERTKWAAVLILFFLFFGYLFRQYRSLTHGPSLILLEPQKNFISHQEKITVKGKTQPDTRVFINNKQIYPNERGEFSQEIFLSKGINQIVILAENNLGKQKTIVREVTFEPL